MNYIEWIQRVFDAAVNAWRDAEAQYGHVTWMPWENLAEPLEIVGEPTAWFNSEQQHVLLEAIRDLDSIGLVQLDHDRYRLTNRGELLAGRQIATAWRGLTAILLTERQENLLQTLSQLAERDLGNYARLIHVNVAEAWTRAQGAQASPILADALGRELGDKRLVEIMPTQDPTARPTYAGFVRATQKAITEDQQLVTQLGDGRMRRQRSSKTRFTDRARGICARHTRFGEYEGECRSLFVGRFQR